MHYPWWYVPHLTGPLGGRAVAGLLTEPPGRTEGLTSLVGDLRSAVSAGSGDLRRARR